MIILWLAGVKSEMRPAACGLYKVQKIVAQISLELSQSREHRRETICDPCHYWCVLHCNSFVRCDVRWQSSYRYWPVAAAQPTCCLPPALKLRIDLELEELPLSASCRCCWYYAYRYQSRSSSYKLRASLASYWFLKVHVGQVGQVGHGQWTIKS